LQISGIEFGFDQTLSRRGHQPSSCCPKATRHWHAHRKPAFAERLDGDNAPFASLRPIFH
jgi:hypothetical protein